MIRSALSIVIACACAFAFDPEAPPVPPQLAAALENAKAAWKINAEVTIRYKPLGDCSALKHEQAAISEPVTEWTIYKDEEDHEIGREPVSSHWYISVNPTCKWTPSYLNQVVLHEYGHVLGLPHSNDKKSIMFWVVWRDREQSITDADRAQASQLKTSQPETAAITEASGAR